MCEGHEQVDQMQLLYYIKRPNQDEFSALMDTGYDKGDISTNSTWNKYQLHNVLAYGNAPDGAYFGPKLSLDKQRKVSVHADVDNLYYEKNASNKIISLHGQFPIDHYNNISQKIYTSKYKRNVLFISEDLNANTPSYLIDTNADEFMPLSLAYTEKLRNSVSIKYYSDYTQNELNTVPANNDSFMRVGNSAQPLWIYLDAIEADVPSEAYAYEHNYTLRELNGDNYQASSLSMELTNDNSASWTSIAIIDIASANRPSAPIKQLDYAPYNYTRPHQVYAYEHSPSVVDIIVRRAKPNYSSSLIAVSLENYGHLRFDLPSDLDIGVVRQKKSMEYGNMTITIYSTWNPIIRFYQQVSTLTQILVYLER